MDWLSKVIEQSLAAEVKRRGRKQSRISVDDDHLTLITDLAVKEGIPRQSLDLIPLDTSDRESIVAFSTSFKNKYDRLDGLINNAGINSTTKALTSEGIEKVFSTNVLVRTLS